MTTGNQLSGTIATRAAAALEALPPARSAFDEVAGLVRRSSRKIVVLDDDPTGTQTVHDIDVLTEWSETSLTAALLDSRPCFFVLTNSRSLPPDGAVALAKEIAANLRAAARATQREYTIISRSDSTLRGHFPAEIDPLLTDDPRGYDGVIVAPAFFEAGRITVNDIHFVRERDQLVPAAETEFARDVTFGYQHSNLCEWIEEKTSGRVRAVDVLSFPLARLRGPNAPDWVRDHLLKLPRGGYAVVNAAAYGDLEVFVDGLLQAEAAGRRFLARTAASFVRVRAAVEPKPLLQPATLRSLSGQGGLVVVGSYTEKTTAQLDAAREISAVVGLELDVNDLADAANAVSALHRLKSQVDHTLAQGRTALVFTSRAHESKLGRAGDLAVGRIVSDALVKLVRELNVRPRFLIAKGGITSSEIAVAGLSVRRARILGQAAPGIPVWKTGEESRWPGLPYVVFPGNVGEVSTLRTLIETFAT